MQIVASVMAFMVFESRSASSTFIVEPSPIMPVVQDSPDPHKRLEPQAVSRPAMRAAEQRSQRRRRWVMRSASFMILSSVALCLIVMWKRDHTTMQRSILELEPLRSQLQDHYDQDEMLPATVELPPDTAYLSAEERHYVRHTSNPVIVAFHPSTSVHTLILRSRGRAVMILEGGELRVESTAEGTRVALAIGL